MLFQFCPVFEEENRETNKNYKQPHLSLPWAFLPDVQLESQNASYPLEGLKERQ